ncbi:transcription elongation factor A protein 1-like isoform X2 [Drosophila obscura]|uniref:transcription elongation factor A protein 1-like isoform X2 n=1 Tax=Drosophila obscura TaxID=7282 RepID=UPI001BB1058C|nr:transcription elongation factor A protein 1-like isoform X2 [Drosophila obscura]
MDSSDDASNGLLDSTAEQQDDTEYDAESMVNMFDELKFLEAMQHQVSFVNNLTEVWDFDPRMRQAFASFEALVQANPTVDNCLNPRHEALVKLANSMAKAAATRQRKSKRKLATAIRNNLIKAVLFVDLRAEYLQEQLRMPTHMLSPEKALELLGILPKESSDSTISSCSSSRSSSSSYELLDAGNSSSCRSSMTADMSDAVRFKCYKMLCNALKIGALADGCAECEPKAVELEAAIYAEFNKADKNYKQRIRSRVSSLKDPLNPGLCSSFLCGAISVEQLAGEPQEGQQLG